MFLTPLVHLPLTHKYDAGLVRPAPPYPPGDRWGRYVFVNFYAMHAAHTAFFVLFETIPLEIPVALSIWRIENPC